jgi:apolipoprotein N-acyltransferase
MPFVYGALLALLSGIVLAGRLMSAERLAAVTDSPRKPLTIILTVALAIFGIETAGFVPAITVTLLALFIVVERLPVVQSFGVAVATAAGLHFLFRVWLGVPLPQGPLGI